MNRWIVITIGAVVAAAAAVAWMLQRPEDLLLSFCIEKERCGYMDADGKTVIAPRFESAGDWVREAGRVWQDGLVGSIDRRGNFITPPQYRSFAFNAGGGHSVSVGDKIRITDHALRPLNSELWDDAKGVKLDLRLRRDPEYIVLIRDGRAGLADSQGRVIVPPRYEDIGWRAHEFPLLFKEHGLFGYLGENGVPISAERWSGADNFHNRLANVERDGKCGYIDPSGNIAIALAFDECRFFWTDVAVVRRGQTYALINRTGQILNEGFADVGIPAEDRNPIVVQVKGKWGAVDLTGNYRIEPTLDLLEPLDIFGDLLPTVPVGRMTIGYRAKVDGKFGLLGTDGRWILQPTYDEIDNDYNGDGKLVVFRSGTKWGFVDLDTRKATPPLWNKVTATSQSMLLPVLDGAKWGYVDRDGNMVIAPRFDQAREFIGDWAPVAIGEKWGFIDSRGGQITPLAFRTVFDYSAERARVLVVESRGWVTRNGRLLGISDEDLKRAGLKT